MKKITHHFILTKIFYTNYFLVLRKMLLILLIIFRFDEKDSISGVQQLKSSVQKSIRNKITESFPPIQDFVDKILPKKDPFKIVKW